MISPTFLILPHTGQHLLPCPQAKWFHPTTGTHLASVGNDRLLRIFALDPGAAPRSGRTFHPIAQISSKSSVPFVSIDIKNVANVYTYLAAIDRLGLVTIYVPESPDKFDSWRRLAQFPVCTPPPNNGEETSFKVRWDPNLTSLAYYAGLTDEKSTLGLVVTALDRVKVYHALLHSSRTGGAVSFIEIASFAPTPKILVRDVQWAPFNVRGVDFIATASKNGDVSILEMSHTANPESAPSTEGKTDSEFPRQTSASASARPAPQSSLTTAIAGRNNNGTPAGSRPATSPASRVLPYSTQIKVATTLTNAHGDAWSVGWDPAGQVLMTNGSEGRTSMWKKSILEGEWKEFSSTEFKVKDSEDGEDWVM